MQILISDFYDAVSMIRDFSVKNFGPFKDRVTLSMERSALRDYADTVIPCEKGILSSALIFGANAAGKSYLIKALASLQSILRRPYTKVDSYSGYQPFRLSKDSLESPVEMRLRMIIDGISYDYSLSYLRNAIVSESLYYYPKGRRVRVFVRSGPENFEYGDEAIIERTNSSSSYVVVASEFNDKVCSTFRTEVMRKIIVLNGNTDYLVNRCCDFIADDPAKKRFAIQALKTADLGISDFVYEDEEIPVSSLDGMTSHPLDMNQRKIVSRKISLKHDLETEGVGDEQTMFPMDIESSGTKAIFGMMGPLVDALLNGATLVIDEFGSSLHPLISRWIVGQFANISNPNGAQLIVNTHDLELMDVTELVRRDQIWFVNRDRKTGASDLYSLADFNDVRKVKSLSKAYLIGRFDAVPNIRARDVIE